MALEQIEDMVPRLVTARTVRKKQDETLATIWRKRGYADGKVDWRMDAGSIRNLVRALARPYPGAHFLVVDREVKLWRVEVEADSRQNIEPGRVIWIHVGRWLKQERMQFVSWNCSLVSPCRRAVSMKTLVVAPHPDDELLGCGGLLLKRGEQGAEIGWLIITAISETNGWPKDAEATRNREIETVRAGLAIASENVFQLGFAPAGSMMYDEAIWFPELQRWLGSSSRQRCCSFPGRHTR